MSNYFAFPPMSYSKIGGLDTFRPAHIGQNAVLTRWIQPNRSRNDDVFAGSVAKIVYEIISLLDEVTRFVPEDRAHWHYRDQIERNERHISIKPVMLMKRPLARRSMTQAEISIAIAELLTSEAEQLTAIEYNESGPVETIIRYLSPIKR